MYAWWPFGGTFEDRYRETMAELDKDESTKATVADETVIPCHTWEITKDPVKLPVLPDLPDLPGTGLPKEELRKETKLIKIAALDNFLVGLTNKGHVLKIDGMTDEDSIQVWRYVSKNVWMTRDLLLSYNMQLPNYSEIDKVKEHAAFRTTTGDDGQEKSPQVESPSDTMLITHVSHIAYTTFWIPCLKLPQRSGFCTLQLLFRLFILHGAQRGNRDYPRGTSNRHPRAPE